MGTPRPTHCLRNLWLHRRYHGWLLRSRLLRRHAADLSFNHRILDDNPSRRHHRGAHHLPPGTLAELRLGRMG